MSNITLNNGILKLNNVDKSKFKSIYLKFRRDLLDCNIPHYRPVAFRLEDTNISMIESNVIKIKELGYSFSELSFILNEIILYDKRGVIPPILLKKSAPILQSDCSFITLNGKDIGTNNISSMFYSGEGISSIPRLLPINLNIFEGLKKNIMITLVLRRNVGEQDFNDNFNLIDTSSGFKTMRTIYSLYDYFSINEYMGEDHFKLNYKKDINEDVLLNILIDYFKQSEVS
jgi:hypothetical protein